MAKKGEISFYEEQKKNKPTVCSLLERLSSEELRKVGYDLLDYFSSLRTNPQWFATNSFNINYKGKRVVRLRIDPHDHNNIGKDGFDLHIYMPDTKILAEYIASLPKNERQPYLDGINCRFCNTWCSPGITIEAGDVSFDNVCDKMANYKRPKPEHLGAIKKIIELRRQDIANGKL